MSNNNRTIIHERIELARKGRNQTVISKMQSGWVVLGDNQIIPGYCILLHDPIVESLNSINIIQRLKFLEDMSIIGDSIIEVLNPTVINYSILGNTDRALHAHIHPRYDWEEEENRKNPPFIYHWKKIPVKEFDYDHDKEMMDKIKKAIQRRI
jgi:diadenosine tetraphosphate (Ap4A) HIT family hydrolase